MFQKGLPCFALAAEKNTATHAVAAERREGTHRRKEETMDFLTRFFDEYATAFLYAALTALAGTIGVVLKRLLARILRSRTKKKVVRHCMKAVEQVYKNRSQEEQYRETVKAVFETLAGQGIYMAEIETMLRIEEEQEQERKKGA